MTTKNFNENSKPEPSAQDFARAFSGPLGPMLGKLGVLSAEQQDASGQAQAEMIAIRDAINDEIISQDAAKNALGEFKGNIDFGKYAKMTGEEKRNTLSALHINQAYIKGGQDAVANAQANRISVNEGHSITVPAIGFIHLDLHARDIPNFGDIKQGALVAQRSIDSAESLERIRTNAPDTDAAAKRGFKLWGDESPALEKAISLNLELYSTEMGMTVDGRAPDIDLNALQARAAESFNATADLFKKAGRDELAAAINTVRANVLQTPPQNPDNNPELKL